ncbi:MAG: hypothetical protein LBK06_07750, partial [Planctomycetaceae bacterium]|nr:hypothetical protein [Planctomycetaceae bacterium]
PTNDKTTINQIVVQNIPPAPAQLLPPVLPPPPMWVYDYASGTIGVYYFTPINPNTTTQSQNQTTPNNTPPQTNTSNQNNQTTPITPPIPRFVAPQIFAPVPTQIYIQPYYQPQIQIYPVPVYLIR